METESGVKTLEGGECVNVAINTMLDALIEIGFAPASGSYVVTIPFSVEDLGDAWAFAGKGITISKLETAQ